PICWLSAAESPRLSSQVPGFKAGYARVTTPSEEWGGAQEGKWVREFQGTLKSEQALAYREKSILPGNHDMWVEKGSGDWFHLFIGNKKNEEATRLRAMFRLYEKEEGVEQLRFELKLTRKGKKLKFSIYAGKSEGHGNLRVVSE
ncbi:MAG: hypothetical protein V3T77_05230, partial [Planctomycetota bacterium]